MDPSYNNSFGSFGSGGTGNGVIFSGGVSGGDSGGGDVVLASGSEKKSKKWAVVLLLFLVVALVGGGVAFLLLGSGKTSSKDFRKDFNRFANYVISGQESDADLTVDYDPSYNYFFLANQGTQEEQIVLYEKTGELLNNFVDGYNKSSDDEKKEFDSEKMDQEIKNEVDLFDFMKIINTKKVLRDSDIMEMYTKNGYDNTLNKVMSYYSFDGDQSNSYMRNFSEFFESWVKAQLGILKTYEENGCVMDGELNYTCQFQENNNFLEELSQYSETVRLERRRLVYYYNLPLNFIENIFTINFLLKGTNGGMLTGENG